MKTLAIKLLIFVFLCISAPTFAGDDMLVATQGPGYISVSHVDCTHPAEEAPSTNKNDVHLDCKTYYQTKSSTCGPAAVMTLLHFYGRLTAAQMVPKTELRIAMEMGATEKGTTMSTVVNWLSGQGFSIDSGIRVSSKQIINNLRKNIPTLIAVEHHWILAKGFVQGSTPAEDQIYFSDSCCGTNVMYAKDVDALWEESMLPGNHCAENIGEYIIAKPK